MKTETIICSKCERVFERKLRRDFWFDYMNDKYPDLVHEILNSDEYKKWLNS